MSSLLKLVPFSATMALARDALRGLPVVGLHGPAHCGKDTTGGFMVAAGFTRFAYADPLKQVCKTAFCLSDAEAFDPRFKNVVIERLGVTPRTLWQTVGTELFRNQIDEDFWLRNMLLRIVSAHAAGQCGKGFVITDVRYDNEAALVRELGGTVVHIRAPRSFVAEAGVNWNHSSEAGIAFHADDMRLDNDGDLEQLRNQSEAIVRFECDRVAGRKADFALSAAAA